MLIIPKNYKSTLNIIETEAAIKALRIHFENALCKNLNLSRVSAPLYVFPESGLNDGLNGVERPVSFDIPEQNGRVAEIVHSLAKWKRYALNKYSFTPGYGVYTNMNAIRRDETTDNIHSLYVDQWDWEKIIDHGERNYKTLQNIVGRIFDAMKETEAYITGLYPSLERLLPEEITFITTSELEEKYPSLSPKEREHQICRDHKAVFLSQIGYELKSGQPHDGRAPDYDDWLLNGDILIYYPVLDIGLELSSMGIRVDETSLVAQLEHRGKSDMLKLPYHKAVLEKELPYTVGGGIGQSRLCMLLLNKAHIGEVQVSLWPDEMEKVCRENGINLL